MSINLKLRKADGSLIGSLIVGYIAVAFVVWKYAPALTSVILPGFIFAVLTILLVPHIRRSKKALQEIKEKQIKDFRQLQSLFSLLRILPIHAPLPVMRGWSVMPDFCNVLIALLQEVCPKVLVEAGSGISTVVSGTYLKSLNQGAHIYSLEHDEAFSKVSGSFIRQHQLQGMVTLSVSALKSVQLSGQSYLWYDVESLAITDPIDLLVIDGPPSYLNPQARYPALPLLISKLSPRAAILMDDGRRDREIAQRWVKEYPQFWMEELPTERGAIILRNYQPD